MRRLLRHARLALALAALAPVALAGGVMPRHYSVADGLAHNDVAAITQDAQGYLWFATREGLSRFDGYAFSNDATAEGLPHPIVLDVHEDGLQRVWVITFEAGLAQWLDRAPWDDRPRFVRHPLAPDGSRDLAYAATVDPRGRLWVVTARGIFRDAGTPAAVRFESVVPARDAPSGCAHRDRTGGLWFRLGGEVVRVDRTGVPGARFGPRPGFDPSGIVAFADDASGAVFAASADAVFAINAAAPDARWRRVASTGPMEGGIRTLFVDRNGRLLAGTTRGLFALDAARGRFTRALALDARVEALFEDREQNLWIATSGQGVYRVPPDAIVGYGVADGLPETAVRRIAGDSTGRIYVATQQGIAEVREDRLVPVAGSGDVRTATHMGRFAIDREDNWWLAADRTIYFVPRGVRDLRRAVPVGTPGAQWGAFTPSLSRDPSGDVWVGAADDLVLRGGTDPAGRPRLEPIRTAAPAEIRGPDRILRDRNGTLWLSTYGGIARWRGRGPATSAGLGGLPSTMARALFVDSRGALWIGLRYHGVAMTPDPAAERPAWTRYTRRDGLSSDTVWTIAADRRGRIYFGTGRGVDRLDPASGSMRSFSVAEGLAGSPVNDLFVDARDRVWVGTMSGLSRIDPAGEQATTAPPVYITRVRAAGLDAPLPARGAGEAPTVSLGRGAGDVRIEFVALSARSAPRLRYEHRLEGLDESWSAASEERAVVYASLPPGTYRFLVRAINGEGVASDPPARVALVVPTPLWRAPWFLALVAAALVLAGYVLQRLRSAHALALERIRRQIALDLHDDVGAGLSQIAVLSEVGRTETGPVPDLWADVAGVARDLRSSMSDIVWAVDPRHDTARDLVRRMRQFALSTLENAGIAVEFNAAPDVESDNVPMRADRRRHVLLVFKEAIHNALRHAAATSVRAEIFRRGKALVVVVRDDGRGFADVPGDAGHGLPGMASRARALGGDLVIRTAPGEGTVVQLEVPLG